MREWRMIFILAFAASLLAFLTPASVTPPTPATVPHADKLAHAGIFLVLAALALPAFPATPRVWILTGLLLYGAHVEAVQALVPGRAPDPLDFAADGLGALVGLLAAARLRVPPPS